MFALSHTIHTFEPVGISQAFPPDDWISLASLSLR